LCRLYQSHQGLVVHFTETIYKLTDSSSNYLITLKDSSNSVAHGGGDVNKDGLGIIRSDAHSISFCLFCLIKAAPHNSSNVPSYQSLITDLLC
jgi:hypothetical protein